MKCDEILHLLRAHRHEMQQNFGVERIGLFGSCARATARQDSDKDIVIELESEKKTLRNFRGIKRYIKENFGKAVDSGIESALTPITREVIAKDIQYV